MDLESFHVRHYLCLLLYFHDRVEFVLTDLFLLLQAQSDEEGNDAFFDDFAVMVEGRFMDQFFTDVSNSKFSLSQNFTDERGLWCMLLHLPLECIRRRKEK